MTDKAKWMSYWTALGNEPVLRARRTLDDDVIVEIYSIQLIKPHSDRTSPHQHLRFFVFENYALKLSDAGPAEVEARYDLRVEDLGGSPSSS